MSARRTVLILGGSIMQLPAIRIARDMGWRVVVADANEQAPGVAEADRFLHVSLADQRGMAGAAGRVRDEEGLDGVFTAGTDFSTTVAWVAGQVGLPGLEYEVARRATDKVLMREALAGHGIPHPRFCRIGDGDDPAAAAVEIGFPAVVKPVDAMGSRGVTRVDGPLELASAVSAALELSRARQAIVETYMDGPELSIDALVCRGQVTICGVADRHIRFPPYFVEMGHTMPSALPAGELEAACEVFAQGVRALGIDNGAAKGDIKITPGGPMIGEIAARLSGGFMSGWTFPLSSGVEVTRGALRIAVGLEPGDLSPTRCEWSAERAVISIPGVVGSFEGVADAIQEPGVVHLFVRTNDGIVDVDSSSAPSVAGMTVVFPTNNVQKCGNIITRASCREDAVASAEGALNRILVRLAPDQENTTAHLLGDPEKAPHEAFSSCTGGAIRSIEGLPAARSGDTRTIGIDSLDHRLGGLGCDWYGLGIDEVMGTVTRHTGAVLGPRGESEGARVGRGFWKAVVRGGAQGGVYYIDTVRSRLSRGASVEDLE